MQERIEEFLSKFWGGAKDLSLNAMKYFIEEYDNFEKEMKFIHIAGTNGKGSCTETISNILEKQGYKSDFAFFCKLWYNITEMWATTKLLKGGHHTLKMTKKKQDQVEMYILYGMLALSIFLLIGAIWCSRDSDKPYCISEQEISTLQETTSGVDNMLLSQAKKIISDAYEEYTDVKPECVYILRKNDGFGYKYVAYIREEPDGDVWAYEIYNSLMSSLIDAAITEKEYTVEFTVVFDGRTFN